MLFIFQTNISSIMGIKCAYCQVVFKTTALRNKHLRSKHIRCDVCNIPFKNQERFHQHVSRMHNENLSAQLPNRTLFRCEHCELQFLTKVKRDNHVNRIHSMVALPVRCPLCREDFPSIRMLKLHKERKHNVVSNFVRVEGAFRNNCEVVRMECPTVKTVKEFFQLYENNIRNELQRQLVNENRVTFKVWIVLYADIYKVTEGQESEYDTFYCRSGKDTNLIRNNDDINRFLLKSKKTIEDRFEALRLNGSNWLIRGFTACSLEIANAKPLNGSCMTEKIIINELKELKDLQVVYEDNRRYKDGCLFYAVAAYFCETDDRRKLDFFIGKHLKGKDIKLPASLSDLTRFEEANKHLDFRINVMEVSLERDTEVYPVRVNKHKAAEHIINVLWVRFYSEILKYKVHDRPDQFCEFGGYGRNEENVVFSEAGSDSDQVTKMHEEMFLKNYGKRGHFLLINDLESFLRYKRNDRYVCPNCLNAFRSYEKYELHENYCLFFKPIVAKMPTAGSKLKFKNFNKKFKVPYAFFYDFETVLETVPSQKCFNCLERNSNTCNHTMKVINRQIPSSYALIMLDREMNIVESSRYTGPDAVEHFLYYLFTFRDIYADKIRSERKSMHISEQQQKEFEAATICHICEQPFGDQHDDNRYFGRKVRDHDVLTSNYLGAAHNKCNLNRVESLIFPAICHNSAKFDSHFILTHLKMITKCAEITAIPNNTESFKVITVKGVQFLDSYAFLSMPLSRLAKDLCLVPNYEYKILDALNLYQPDERNKKEMLLTKQIYPYEYITSFDVYDEKHLPPKEKFFSTLSNCGISDSDFEHACKVFKVFGCQDLRDYTELYCLLDVALLAEAVMQFREIIYQDGGLDMFQYLSLPQLSLDFQLKQSKNEYELISDPTMHVMLEQNIRGGVVYAAQRYIENDEQDNESDLMYVDMNNLYGLSMKGLLPTSNYQWLELHELEAIDWYTVDTEGSTGYILMVDISYPPEIHDFLMDFPPAPENKQLTYDMLSPYAQCCLNNLYDKTSYKACKLVASLEPKKSYLVHFANLQYYLRLGIKLDKIHCGFKFQQSRCFKDYIEYCTQKRKNSVSTFQGSTYKLLCNSLYGKTLENEKV